jgi:hypothetical protein
MRAVRRGADHQDGAARIRGELSCEPAGRGRRHRAMSSVPHLFGPAADPNGDPDDLRDRIQGLKGCRRVAIGQIRRRSNNSSLAVP